MGFYISKIFEYLNKYIILFKIKAIIIFVSLKIKLKIRKTSFTL